MFKMKYTHNDDFTVVCPHCEHENIVSLEGFDSSEIDWEFSSKNFHCEWCEEKILNHPQILAHIGDNVGDNIVPGTMPYP